MAEPADASAASRMEARITPKTEFVVTPASSASRYVECLLKPARTRSQKVFTRLGRWQAQGATLPTRRPAFNAIGSQDGGLHCSRHARTRRRHRDGSQRQREEH